MNAFMHPTGYAAVVLGLGQLLSQDSSLVVAAATPAVAAPMLHLVSSLQLESQQ